MYSLGDDPGRRQAADRFYTFISRPILKVSRFVIGKLYLKTIFSVYFQIFTVPDFYPVS